MHTLKKFIHYYGPYKAVFFLDLICATIISLVDLAYPQILRTCTNTLFTKSSSSILSALLPIAAGLLIMYLIQSLCKYYVSYQGHMMGAYMERDMRQQLFDHYEKLSFSYYDQNNSGQMMSKLVSDLFDIAEFAHHGPENLFISVIKIIGSFIFLFLINWKLAIPLLFLVFLHVCIFYEPEPPNAVYLYGKTGRKSEMSIPVCRTPSPESAWFSLSQTRMWKKKNSARAITIFCSPRMPTTNAWAVLWAITCFSRE